MKPAAIPKICRDCTHFAARGGAQKSNLCRHPSVREVDLVTGVPSFPSAAEMRRPPRDDDRAPDAPHSPRPTRCGPDGALHERRSVRPLWRARACAGWAATTGFLVVRGHENGVDPTVVATIVTSLSTYAAAFWIGVVENFWLDKVDGGNSTIS